MPIVRLSPQPSCWAQGAGGDEHLEVGGGAADRRDDRETEQAGDQGDTPAEQVGEPAAEQQQRTESQGVRRDDPLPVVGAEPEVGLGRGQGDVHDSGVEDDHQLCYADDAQDRPPMRHRTGSRPWIGRRRIGSGRRRRRRIGGGHGFLRAETRLIHRYSDAITKYQQG
jgi:hypothetical protein